jgi:hypothetical protein
MDRPNTAMSTAVNAGLAMTNRRGSVAYLVARRVQDNVIARLLSERVDASCQDPLGYKHVSRIDPAFSSAIP